MTDSWNTRTKLVHQGARRSQYGEVAEAIYMTQGFVYPTAEAAEARFLGTGPDELSMRATATRPLPPLKNALPQSKGQRTLSPRHPEWPPCRVR